MSSRRKHRSRLAREERFILDVLTVLVGGLVLLRYLPDTLFLSLEWFSGNQVVRFLLGMFALGLAFYNFRRKRRIAGGVNIVPAAIILIEVFVYVPFIAKHKTIDPARRLRVLTMNAATKPIPGVFHYIESDSVDIACLQELYVRYRDALIDTAKAHGYDARFVLLRDDAGMGTMVISREPILKADTLFTSSWGDKIRRFERVVTTHNGQPVRVVSLQLESTERSKNLWGVIRSWKLRLEQAGRVHDALIGIMNPLVVAGDFNATVTNRAVHPLYTTYDDSWIEAGAGLGGTWSKSLPLLRIDYILHNDQFDGAANAKRIHLGESDHLAYRVDLILR